MNHELDGLTIISQQDAANPTIQLEFSSPTLGWSSANLAFDYTDLTASTLFKSDQDLETQDKLICFQLNSGELTSMVLADQTYSPLVSDEGSLLTELPFLCDEPINAFLASGGYVSFVPTDLQNTVFGRVRELMDLAHEDQIEMSSSSFWDLWAFISNRPTAPVPNVFALDSGHFRAVWKNPQGERVALEFQGNQIVAFVIFQYDLSLEKMMRMAGMQVLNRVEAQITAARVNHLLSR
jgi:hypothetical protein